MNIQRTDFVLEIGSGDNPHPSVDILCDRYITTSHERAGGFKVRIDRPMVVADGMRLPFRDRTFDYVIASHIFEHMDDPLGFAREIMRVGKAGYIEVPSAISERVFGWDFHHWYCQIHDGVLTVTPKKEGERWNGFFHRFIARTLWFRRFFEEHEEMWYVRMEWREKIPIRVGMRPMGEDETHELDEKAWELLAKAKPEIVKDLLFSIRFFFRRVIRKVRKIARRLVWMVIQDMPGHCVCPRCHGSLRSIEGEKKETLDPRLRGDDKILGDDKIICECCAEEYPMDGVIPILLLPEERKKGW